MKFIKLFEDYTKINEISQSVIDSATSKMTSLGQKRGDEYKKFYSSRDYQEYIGVMLLDGNIKHIEVNSHGGSERLSIYMEDGKVYSIDKGRYNINGFDEVKNMVDVRSLNILGEIINIFEKDEEASKIMKSRLREYSHMADTDR